MKLIDLTGHRFGRLTVLSRAVIPKPKKTYWLCLCDCGNRVSVRGDHLKYGMVQSCGCYNREISKQAHTKHGGYHTRLYKVYRTMLARCYNPNNGMYQNYGGRGISVCAEWRSSFEAFRDWAMSNGYDEAAPFGECTIDRIDVNGDYEPTNCRWADMLTQAKNKRRRVDVDENTA